MAVLSALDLHKQYQLGEHQINALNGVDFSVAKGEFVAIMGPSGERKIHTFAFTGWIRHGFDGRGFAGRAGFFGFAG
jgi:putative ABC transport system ATP-binding protein